jgi:branched-chain amino acid transport system substrate-binding protein
MQASNHAATLHFLKTVKELGPEKAQGAGRATVAAMKQMPTEDDCFGNGLIRVDGRKIHPSYLFRVKQDALCAAQMSYGHSGGKIQTKEEFIADATSGKAMST